jgi:NADP-dependent 3-hydroxy acid dehydrogenase YdfG
VVRRVFCIPLQCNKIGVGQQRARVRRQPARGAAWHRRGAPVFRRQGRGHFVTTVSTAGLKIVPTMVVYAATKNAVRTVMEGLRQESTDGVVRTTSISPGFVDTQLDSSIDDMALREQIRRTMSDFGLPAAAVARAIAFAIEQPDGVEIGDITIRPTVQG